MNSSISASRFRVRKLVILALFAALAYVVEFVLHIKVSFLTFDAKDAILTIGGMIYGPISALILSFLVSLIEFITISDTGIWGFIMNFAGSAAFAFTAAIIYKYKKTWLGAVISLISAVVSMTAIMLVANLIITPIYMGTDVSTVVSLIPTLLLPFNLAKAGLNASIVLILYKPITTTLREAKLIPGDSSTYKFDKNTVIMLGIALAMLAGSILLFFILGGKFSLT
jgi:riboflavin transporter FmnP